MKVALGLGILGEIIGGIACYLITLYHKVEQDRSTPEKRKMADLLRDEFASNPSMAFLLAYAVSDFLLTVAYIALGFWMKAYSTTAAAFIIVLAHISFLIFLINIVIRCTTMQVYRCLDNDIRIADACDSIDQRFKSIQLVGDLSRFALCILLFVMVVLGKTSLSPWAGVLILLPQLTGISKKYPFIQYILGMVMMIGLLILI